MVVGDETAVGLEGLLLVVISEEKLLLLTLWLAVLKRELMWRFTLFVPDVVAILGPYFWSSGRRRLSSKRSSFL